MTPFVEASRHLVKRLLCRTLSEIATKVEPLLQWRHHGLGMLQAEFSEELRIHVWHPKLVSPGMAWPRCVHDHRFDITSAVVIGEVIDVPHEVQQAHTGKWTHTCEEDPYGDGAWHKVNVYEIEHAKEQDRMVDQKGCSTATSARLLYAGSALELADWRQPAGHEYFIPKRVFHTTRIDRLAVSVVHRANFDDRLARVLCAPDSNVTAVSGIVRDESAEHAMLIRSVLEEAARAIGNL
jgi:hypothetical protein